jgi:hypothetical protein
MAKPVVSPILSWGGPRRTARYHGDFIGSNFGTGRPLHVHAFAHARNPDPRRRRKLLLHRGEIDRSMWWARSLVASSPPDVVLADEVPVRLDY